MAVKVEMTPKEWEDAKSKSPKLAELDEVKMDTPKPITTVKPNPEPPIEYEYEERFMYRTHEFKNWLLIPMIIFSLVGLGFTAYGVYLYWFWVLIGTIIAGVISLIVKIRRSR